MAGLIPAIHVFGCCQKDVDARHKAGHDGSDIATVRVKFRNLEARSPRPARANWSGLEQFPVGLLPIRRARPAGETEWPIGTFWPSALLRAECKLCSFSRRNFTAAFLRPFWSCFT